MTTPTYSLKQAADLTGYSLGKFRYNKTKLIEAGAAVHADGWRIPHRTLETLGWIGNKPARTTAIKQTPLQVAEARIEQLERENAALLAKTVKRKGLFRR